MWRHLAEPLLARELISGTRKPEKGVFVYPGPGKMLVLTIGSVLLMLGVVGLWRWGKGSSFIVLYDGLVLIAWLQMFLLLWRCGSYASASISSDMRNGFFQVLASSPLGVMRTLGGKMLSALLPLWLELLGLAPLLGLLFCVFGTVPFQSYLAILGLQLAASIFFTAMGLFIGCRFRSPEQSVRMYRQMVGALAVAGFMICSSSSMGVLATIVVILGFLLFWLPALNNGNGTVAGALALVAIVLLPMQLFFDTGALTEPAHMLNPFVTMGRMCPINLADKQSLRFSSIVGEYRTSQFINRCYEDLTGIHPTSTRLSNAEFALAFSERLQNCSTLPQYSNAVKHVNQAYVQWRISDAIWVALGYLALFIFTFVAVRSRVGDDLSGVSSAKA